MKTLDYQQQEDPPIYSFLKFTVELGEDFPDGKLPSLDTSIWVKNTWTILFMFFEKTMSANLMVKADSVLNQDVKMATMLSVWFWRCPDHYS